MIGPGSSPRTPGTTRRNGASPGAWSLPSARQRHARQLQDEQRGGRSVRLSEREVVDRTAGQQLVRKGLISREQLQVARVDERINRRPLLESIVARGWVERMKRTIRTLDSVQDARVHLVIPERPLFSRDKVEPSASIVLRVRGSLEPGQVRAIRHLVATAVNEGEISPLVRSLAEVLMSAFSGILKYL